ARVASRARSRVGEVRGAGPDARARHLREALGRLTRRRGNSGRRVRAEARARAAPRRSARALRSASGRDRRHAALRGCRALDPLGAREDTLMRPEIKWAAAGGCLTLLALGSVLGIAGGVLTLAARRDVASSETDRFAAKMMQAPKEEMAYPSSPPPPPASMPEMDGARGGTADRIDAPSRLAGQKTVAFADEQLLEKKSDANGAETGP